MENHIKKRWPQQKIYSMGDGLNNWNWYQWKITTIKEKLKYNLLNKRWLQQKSVRNSEFATMSTRAAQIYCSHICYGEGTIVGDYESLFVYCFLVWVQTCEKDKDSSSVFLLFFLLILFSSKGFSSNCVYLSIFLVHFVPQTICCSQIYFYWSVILNCRSRRQCHPEMRVSLFFFGNYFV